MAQLKIQVVINKVPTAKVQPAVFNGILNGSGSAQVVGLNALIVPGVCDTGYFWNVSECVRCSCESRQVFANGWILVDVLR